LRKGKRRSESKTARSANLNSTAQDALQCGGIVAAKEKEWLTIP
jgi:hypothetical protein